MFELREMCFPRGSAAPLHAVACDDYKEDNEKTQDTVTMDKKLKVKACVFFFTFEILPNNFFAFSSAVVCTSDSLLQRNSCSKDFNCFQFELMIFGDDFSCVRSRPSRPG